MPRRKRAKPARRTAARPAPRVPEAPAVAPATPDTKSAAGSAVACADAARAAAPGGGGEAQPPPACSTVRRGCSARFRSTLTPPGHDQGPPRLRKAGYYTRPPAEQLAALPDAALAALTGFAVGRTGYGLIEWEGASARVAVFHAPCAPF